MKRTREIAGVLALALLVVASLPCSAAAPRPEVKRLTLLGQKRDHPEGRHEYMAGLRILRKCLRDVPGLEVRIVAADEPWPEGPRVIRQSDGVVLYLGEGAKWFQAAPDRLAALRELARRGGGIVGLHWSIGAKEAQYVEVCLELLGACHGGPDRRYVVMEGDVRVVDRNHPVTAGIADFRIHNEFYFKLKLARQGTVRPLLQVRIEGGPETVAWAYQRPDGGRSFGFGGMDEHRNWGVEAYRRLAVQAILWTLDLPAPKQGLRLDVSKDDLKMPAPEGR